MYVYACLHTYSCIVYERADYFCAMMVCYVKHAVKSVDMGPVNCLSKLCICDTSRNQDLSFQGLP